MKTSITRLSAAVALGVTAVALPGAAMAQPAPIGPSNVDASQTATIEVHKHLGAPTGDQADGTEQTVDLPTLSGVEFDVYRVSVGNAAIDLSTNEGWTTLQALDGYTITQADVTNRSFEANGVTYTLTSAGSVTTGADGSATFNGPIGVYVFDESVETDDTITNNATREVIPANSVTGAAPFLVTNPMLNPNGDAWMYDIDVYPKNQADSITKTVLDGNIGTDGEYAPNGTPDGANLNTLTYVLNSTVQSGGLGYYAVTDTLPKGVDYVSSELVFIPSGSSLEALPSAAAEVTLEEGVHYVLNVNEQTGQVVWSLTTEGLNLVGATGGTLTTRVVADVDVTGLEDTVLENTAGLVPSGAWLVQQGITPPNPGEVPPSDTPSIPSNEVESRYGQMAVYKTGVGEQALSGAEFAVYAENGDNTCDDADVAEGVDPLVTGTTNEAGIVVFQALQVSNFYNGAEQEDAHTYCVVETAAPAGYVLDETPREFSLTRTGTLTATTVDNLSQADTNFGDSEGAVLAVKNVPENIDNTLPLTGGEGQDMFPWLLGAGALTLLGGGAYAASQRKEKAKAQA